MTLPRDVPKLDNLQGAVQRVIINGEVFEKLMENGVEQQNVVVYRGPPCGHMPATHPSSSRSSSYSTNGKESSSPCQNGGVCQPLLSSFVCKCQTGFLGKRCEKRMVDFKFSFFIKILNLESNNFLLQNTVHQATTTPRSVGRSDSMARHF